jgi:hypothetical protein
VLGHRRGALAAQYGSVESAVQQLFALSDYASQDPAGFLQYFAQSRGIDLSRFAPAPSQQQGQPIDPNIAHLQAQLAQLTGHIQAQEQQRTTQQQQSLVSEVERFSADPQHKYFENVQQHLLMLLPGIKAANPNEAPAALLKIAYDQAVWANPETRAAMMQEQTTQAQAQSAARAAQKRNASVSISGSPVAGASTYQAGPDDLRGQLEAAFGSARV